MRKWVVLFLGLACVLSFAMTSKAADEKVVKMSSTTSTLASGLFDVLLPAVKKDLGIDVKVVAKGTGAAIKDGADGNVDVIFVHDLAREEKFVADGFGTKRYAVMHNDFVIVGPPKDPAGIKGLKNASEALNKIAKAQAPFISRGDDSGTHAKEQDLWKASGLTLEKKTQKIVDAGKEREISFVQPTGSWYLSIGQGMDKTLTFADEKRGYALADRGTYIQFKYGPSAKIDLDILCEGDQIMFNPYGVIPVNPKKYSHVKYDLVMELVNWLVGPKGQSVIKNYQILGQQVFYPDAIPDVK